MMKVTLCGLVFCVVLFVVKSHASDDGTVGGKKGRLMKISKKLDSLMSLVEGMQKDKEQCCSQVSDMDMDVRELTNKIEDLDSACLTADLNIAGQEGKPCDSKVRIELPEEFHKCLQRIDRNRMSDLNTNIWCLRVVLWRYSDTNNDEELLDLLQEESDEADSPFRIKRSLQFLRRRIAPRDITKPRSGFRIRKEYRTLTLEERQRYHDALKVLYEDGTLEGFALIHQAAIKKKGAHGGPAFLPWHRAFLALYEEALRQVDPTVTLPYWDSSIDDNIEAGPGLSVIWDKHHFGQGTGLVDKGPFAEWLTPTNPLSRNIARGVGSLMRQTKIDSLFSYCRLMEFGKRLEYAHNDVHRWVGGTMTRSLAACDPIFYMHHAFIDYQWEKLREHQVLNCGIDPEYDYPPTDDVHHQADTKMDGMRFLTNKDGIAEFWTTNWYKYEERPSCENNCGNSPDMFCDHVLNLCVAELRFNLTDVTRKKRQTGEDKLVDGATELEACKTNIYAPGCSTSPRPKTQEENVKTMVLEETKLPSPIAEMIEELKSEIVSSEMYPSESEPLFFEGAPDEPNDSRTMETSALNMLNMVTGGRTTAARRYAEELHMVRPM